MFIQTQDGVVINGARIAEMRVEQRGPEDDSSFMVEGRITRPDSSDIFRILFRGTQAECERQLQQYTDTLNNTPLVRAIRSIGIELRDE